MWQHEIVDSITKQVGYDYAKNHLAYLFSALRHSVCFYFGDDSEGIIPQEFDAGPSISPMPFPVVCFEWKAARSGIKNCIFATDVDMLLDAIRQNPNGNYNEAMQNISSLPEWERHATFIYCFVGETTAWYPSPVVSIYDKPARCVRPLPNTFFTQEYMIQTYCSKSSNPVSELNKLCDFTFPNTAADFFGLLDFLNCRNVYTESVIPDERLNRKRVKSGKTPMIEYKVLKVQKGVPKVKYTNVTHPWGKVPRDIVTAQHICRGHFKEYSEEHPLFGKYAGRFWWGPQVRGDAKNGQIIKDYAVE